MNATAGHLQHIKSLQPPGLFLGQFHLEDKSEMNGKVGNTIIWEGMEVEYEICPPALSLLIKESFLPPLQKLFYEFPWDFSTITVCETGSWHDISKMDPFIPYFQG
ncbi:hypothetical protein CVT25_003732 [Psilocybe cyanescens]|uniref:Uncharacterized protein n=1 Tax=Psilocybe cyanescens TaxID=93625 RepID=A0A409XPL5_PSICY|nr:hypothetical protein CVT25_003732 [Psilocybe cyanescens]